MIAAGYAMCGRYSVMVGPYSMNVYAVDTEHARTAVEKFLKDRDYTGDLDKMRIKRARPQDRLSILAFGIQQET